MIRSAPSPAPCPAPAPPGRRGLPLALCGALLGLVPAGHAAPEPAALTVDGSFWTRFESRENYAGAGVSAGRFQEGDALFYRARLGLWAAGAGFGQGHRVQPRFVLQAAGIQGSLPGTINDAPVGAHEAFVRWSGPWHRFDFGRFELAYGEHFIIGNLGWHQVARSWDGVRVRLQREGAGPWLDLFATLARPDAIPGEKHPSFEGLFEGDDWFAGAYGDLGPALDPKLTLELYALFQIQRSHAATGAGPARDGGVLTTAGARAARRLADTRVRFEGTVQRGTGLDGREAAAWQADLELRQHFSPRLWLALGGNYASGDDPATETDEGFNHLYSTGHMFFGLMDVIGLRNNVASALFKLTWELREGTRLQLDGHVFFRPEPQGEVEGYAGSEADLQLTRAIGGGLGIRGLYGLFLPGEGYPTAAPVHYLACQLGYEFQ